MRRGKYIVIEGLDGSGKSTQHQLLLEAIGEGALGVREPGGTPMAEAVRTLVKDGSISRSPRTNVYLFSAARVELMDNVVRPALREGTHVIADRNWLSTVAAQTAEGVENLDEIYQLCKAATEELFMPNLVIFIDTPVEICRQRLNKRGDGKGDYFEEFDDEFFTRVRAVYLDHLKALPHAVVPGELPAATLAARLRELVLPL